MDQWEIVFLKSKMKQVTLFFFVLLSIFSCQKDKTSDDYSTPNSSPYIATPALMGQTTITGITTTSFSCNAIVINDGQTSVIERGICYGTTEGPTISGSKKTEGSGTGSFSSTILGLVPQTTYFIRGYTCNNAGVSYSNQLSITTN